MHSAKGGALGGARGGMCCRLREQQPAPVRSSPQRISPSRLPQLECFSINSTWQAGALLDDGVKVLHRAREALQAGFEGAAELSIAARQLLSQRLELPLKVQLCLPVCLAAPLDLSLRGKLACDCGHAHKAVKEERTITISGATHTTHQAPCPPCLMHQL